MVNKEQNETIEVTAESKAIVESEGNALQDLGFTPTTVTLTKQQAEQATGVKGRKYFPIVLLTQKMSRIVEKGVTVGSWVYKKNNKDDKYIDLGTTFPVFILGVRGKALFWDKVSETMDTQYCIAQVDGSLKETEKYNEYVLKAREGGTGQYSDNPYRQGLEVLLWIPNGLVNDFAVYFANTPTTISSVEEEILPYVNKAVMWASVRKENKKGIFYNPTCYQLDGDEIAQLENKPTPEEYKEAIQLFVAPPRYSPAGSDDTPIEKSEETNIER